MAKAKVTRKSHSRRERGGMVTYNEGDEMNASERELEVFGDRLERIEAKGRPKKTEPKVSGDGEASGE